MSWWRHLTCSIEQHISGLREPIIMHLLQNKTYKAQQAILRSTQLNPARVNLLKIEV